MNVIQKLSDVEKEEWSFWCGSKAVKTFGFEARSVNSYFRLSPVKL